MREKEPLQEKHALQDEKTLQNKNKNSNIARGKQNITNKKNNYRRNITTKQYKITGYTYSVKAIHQLQQVKVTSNEY